MGMARERERERARSLWCGECVEVRAKVKGVYVKGVTSYFLAVLLALLLPTTGGGGGGSAA